MSELTVINRETKTEDKEKIYGKFYIDLLYGKHPLASFFRLFCKCPFFSKCYGNKQKNPKSKAKIAPFIKHYNIDSSEFLDPVESFNSFNDFFIRKLKPSARPITNGNDQAVLPADGRYLAFSNIEREEGFWVKGKKFSLPKLLGSDTLAHKYHQGSMAIIRLAPVDYHRFHFPCNCVPTSPRLINGHLYSVNPIALKTNIEILTENKRMITELKTSHFGTVLFIEVGATNVGSIHQTFNPENHYAKGDEKGYFSFGGSCILLLFEPFRIQFDQDLLDNTHKGIETLGKLGQSLGRALQG